MKLGLITEHDFMPMQIFAQDRRFEIHLQNLQQITAIKCPRMTNHPLDLGFSGNSNGSRTIRRVEPEWGRFFINRVLSSSRMT